MRWFTSIIPPTHTTSHTPCTYTEPSPPKAHHTQQQVSPPTPCTDKPTCIHQLRHSTHTAGLQLCISHTAVAHRPKPHTATLTHAHTPETPPHTPSAHLPPSACYPPPPSQGISHINRHLSLPTTYPHPKHHTLTLQTHPHTSFPPRHTYTLSPTPMPFDTHMSQVCKHTTLIHRVHTPPYHTQVPRQKTAHPRPAP